MRARLISEIKQGIKRSGLGVAGLGKTSYLKGYYMIKEANPDLIKNRTLYDSYITLIDDKFFKEKGNRAGVEKFFKTLEEVIGSKLDNFALIDMSECRRILPKKLFSSENDEKDVIAMFPSNSGRPYGEKWSYQILYNKIYNVGYVELYDGLTGDQNAPSIFNFFVKYK